MICPRCGLDLRNDYHAVCPRCGQPLAGGPPQASAGWQEAPGPRSIPLGGQGGGMSGMGGAATWADYGGPAAPPPQAYPPSYPAPAQGPYGQPAMPSVPLYGQGMGPGYSPGYPPAFPPQTPSKSRMGLFIGIGVTLALVLVVGAGALIALSGGSGASRTAAKNTPTPIGATATPTETVLYANALAPSASGWADDGTNCASKADGYHVIGAFECFAPSGAQTDFTVSVQAKLVSGPTTNFYGIGFRLDRSSGNEYFFGVDANSAWVFGKYVGKDFTSIQDPTRTNAVHGGLNTVNMLTVHAQGSHFDFFVNGSKVGEADDSSYTSGSLGLEGDQDLDVVFTNIKVTK